MGDVYGWVSAAMLEVPSKFLDVGGVRRLGPSSFWVRGGKDVKVEFLSCALSDRAKGVDRGIWVALSSHQGRTVFSLFKPSYRDFKNFYIKVKSSDDAFVIPCIVSRADQTGFAQTIV
ncbi:hypothetical protein PIB30_086661 [Stylosanthes scabra]|uniref:Uncharacterized protein n=1 Tax=Stylosanthes scabra TaxID=79078 RepID=A0ABU6RT39_9FABA|nr:hypothetical protein [Stylosanthes scabra]